MHLPIPNTFYLQAVFFMFMGDCASVVLLVSKKSYHFLGQPYMFITIN